MFARVAVGSLVLHEAGGYIPPPPGPQTGRYIAKIAAGGNQGNRTRNRQVLSEIYRVGIGRKEAREWKTVETCCHYATQTERTVFKFVKIIFQPRPQKPGPSPRSL